MAETYFITARRAESVPSTPLEEGIVETMRRSTQLREAGRLDTGEFEAELLHYGRNPI